MSGKHHNNIHVLLNEADTTLAEANSSRARVLALIRWQLMRRLRTYRLIKHTKFFAPISSGSDIFKSNAAEAMKARCIAIGENYNHHVEKWSAAGIEGNWAAYETEIAQTILAIRSHLTRELAEAGMLLSEGAPRSPAVRSVGS